MNITGLNEKCYFNVKPYLRALKIEPLIYNFISIIQSTVRIQTACLGNRLNVFLKSDKQLITPRDYRAVVYPALGLNYHCSLNTFKERTEIARKYAKILEQYHPDDKGNINKKFNYYHLVSVIKEVFENHIFEEEALFDKGLEIIIDGKTFYAKVESPQIYMFFAKCELLGDGANGRVGEIYEIASQQLLAFKWAEGDISKEKRLNREIYVLKNLHAKADFEGYSLVGLQDPPLATFHLPEFSGFLGKKLGINLHSWCERDHSNEDRISMCKSIIASYINVYESRFWQGDIKLENILESENGVVFIDWDGSIPIHNASAIHRPKSLTTNYISLEDLADLESLEDEWDESGMTCELRLRYEKVAHSMELFSIAIVLFCVLVSKEPFTVDWVKNYEAIFPITHKGINQESWDALVEKKYDYKIGLTIARMLRSSPNDRSSLQEVIDFWRKI